jgi:hypothetical protein
MKIRQGFISNSSSSSFVIICHNSHPIVEKFEVHQDNRYGTIFEIIYRKKTSEAIIFGTRDNHDEFFFELPKDIEYYRGD